VRGILSLALVAGGLLAATAALAEDPLETASITERTPTKRRGWFQRLFVKPTWEEARRDCATPADVCRMVRRHVVYREDAVDRWATAEETWQRGAGDCEDFAVCVQKLCRELGIEASVQVFYALTPGRGGHAVVVGEWEGRPWLSDNGSYERLKEPADVAARVSRDLWCKADEMWTVTLNDADIAKLTGENVPLSPGDGPVAAREERTPGIEP
jgi:transglutaminase-like putative cysteine protease